MQPSCGRLSIKPSLAPAITDSMSGFKPLMHRRVSVNFFELRSLTIPRRRQTFRKPTCNFKYLIRAYRYFSLWLGTFNRCRSCAVYTYAVSFSDWALLCFVTDLTSADAWKMLGVLEPLRPRSAIVHGPKRNRAGRYLDSANTTGCSRNHT